MSFEVTGPPLVSPWMMLSMSEARNDIDETKIVIPGHSVCDAPQQFMRYVYCKILLYLFEK